jgi:hypothetical protein
MERKLARAQGHRTEDETRALRDRIEQLGSMLAGANAEHAMLLGQVGGARRGGTGRPWSLDCDEVCGRQGSRRACG